MAIQIRPRGRLEDEVIKRVLSYIPEGDFYLRAQYELPILNGTGITPFIVRGTRGRIVQVKLNGQLVSRIGLVADEETVYLQLNPPPVINEVTVIDELDSSTDSISAVTTNYASVYTGAAIDYFRKIYVPYLFQEWSLTSEWTARHTEYMFKYHRRFPDTQAMRVLATRLNARAVYSGGLGEGPGSLGVRSQVQALCASMPVVVSVDNRREDLVGSFNIGMVPLLPVQADYNGHELNCWFPDSCAAREHAFLHLSKNFPDFYQIKHAVEGNIELKWQDTYIQLLSQQDEEGCNLRGVLSQIGSMDYWQSFLDLSAEVEIYYRYYSYGPDLVVTKTLGGGNTWDQGVELDQGISLDSNDPFSEKWDLLDVAPTDVGETLDSNIKRAVCAGEVRVDKPFASEWELTAIDGQTSTVLSVTNPLHGGAPPEFTA